MSAIASGESVRKTVVPALVLELILVCAPVMAGKNLEWISEGLKKPNLGAASLVRRKYGSCVFVFVCVCVRERVRERECVCVSV